MIEQTEVDGVPVLLAPTTGPAHAGLAFRVGFADEPLTRRGITHLVEHLALHSTSGADYHYNGATGTEHTYFHMQGSEEELADFLTGVCASLRELPMPRLEVEKEVLRAEANGRKRGPAESMAIWRHGARDYGMAGYPEWGLPAVGEEELRDWVARYFTRENAVVWVAGDKVPAGLRLDLPSGARPAPPARSSALPVTPAWFAGSSQMLMWDAEVPRGVSSAAFAGVLDRVMLRELRQEGGFSYTAQASYEPLVHDRALVTAVADALPEKNGALLGAFADVLATFRLGRIDEADLAVVVKKQTGNLRIAEDQGSRLPGQALNLLAGRPVQEVEEAIAAVRSVTVAEVAEVAAAATAGGLLMTPRTHAEWAGFTAAPDRSESAVTGTELAAVDNPAERLIAGPEGVSVVSADSLATVRFADCALVRAWPDGGRQFIGHDSIVVWWEPTLYAGAAAAQARLDSWIPPGLRIDQPARGPSQIPQPAPAAVEARQEQRDDRVMAALGLFALVPLTLFAFMVAALLPSTAGDETADIAATWGTFVLVFGLAVAGTVQIVRLVRRIRKRRA